VIRIDPGDRKFTDSPDAGHPKCLCSRCGKRIGEDIVPVRAFPEDGACEYRYHPACVGMAEDEDDCTEEFLDEDEE
jgi:hypothetical protein